MNHTIRKGGRIWDFDCRPDKAVPTDKVEDLTSLDLLLNGYEVVKNLGAFIEPLARGLKHVLTSQPQARRVVATVGVLMQRTTLSGDQVKHHLAIYWARWAEGSNSEAPLIAPGDNLTQIVRNGNSSHT